VLPIEFSGNQLSVFCLLLAGGKCQYRLKWLVALEAKIQKNRETLLNGNQKKLARVMDDAQESTSVESRDAENTSSRKLQKTCENRKVEANGCSERTAERCRCNRQHWKVGAGS
jgi:hypothetical protein